MQIREGLDTNLHLHLVLINLETGDRGGVVTTASPDSVECINLHLGCEDVADLAPELCAVRLALIQRHTDIDAYLFNSLALFIYFYIRRRLANGRNRTTLFKIITCCHIIREHIRCRHAAQLTLTSLCLL